MNDTAPSRPATVSARVTPIGGLAVLSRHEVTRLRDVSDSGLHTLLRRCALAVLTSGNISDDPRGIAELYPDFDIEVIQQDRGVKLKLDKLATRMQQNNKIRLDIPDTVIDTITARCTEVDSGARNIDFILRGSIMPMLSNTLLANMAEGRPASRARLNVDADGQFSATFS